MFVALAAVAIALSPRLAFDSDPLHTKNPNTEAMRTLHDLMDDPLTNPYSISILSPNVAAAVALKAKLVKLPTVSKVIDIDSFVPDDQQAEAGDHRRRQFDPVADAAGASGAGADHAG